MLQDLCHLRYTLHCFSLEVNLSVHTCNAHAAVKVVVRTRRSGAGVDSTNTGVEECVANADGPGDVAGDAFFGVVARQGQ